MYSYPLIPLSTLKLFFFYSSRITLLYFQRTIGSIFYARWERSFSFYVAFSLIIVMLGVILFFIIWQSRNKSRWSRSTRKRSFGFRWLLMNVNSSVLLDRMEIQFWSRLMPSALCNQLELEHRIFMLFCRLLSSYAVDILEF